MENNIGQIKRLAEDRLNEKITSIKQLDTGRNSNIFKILTTNNKYIAKEYIKRKGDRRQRLTTEFRGLSFLWKNNINNIPEPIFLDKKLQVGIYRYIEGERIKADEITLSDVKKAGRFLKSLYLLIFYEDAWKQPIASEANFSIQDYIEDIKKRLKILKLLPRRGRIFLALNKHLDKDFIPYFEELILLCNKECLRRGIDIKKKLLRNRQTLSPTDFSFHNALRRRDNIYFLDFEYWGWDDPAKVIANFYLHPAVLLPASLRKSFFKEVYGFFSRDKDFKNRLPLVYMLMSMKWCLIMLNIFKWGSGSGGKDGRNYITQLNKAKKQLLKTKREIKIRQFPLSL